MRWPDCLIASFLLCAVPHAVRSQTFYGVSGGMGFAGPNPTVPGFVAQASFGHSDSRGEGWRLDAFAAGGFDVTRADTIQPICTLPGLLDGCGNPAVGHGPATVGMAGLALNGLIPLRRSTDGTVVYALAGGEVDRLTGGQGAPRNLLFGWSPGVGVALAPERRRRTIVEARFHGIVDPAGLPSWTLLVTVGMQWSLFHGTPPVAPHAAPETDSTRRLTHGNIAMATVSTAVIAGDWLTTMHNMRIAERQGLVNNEINPILGPHPSIGRVNTVFAIGTVLNLGVGATLNSDNRNVWWSIVTTIEALAIIMNVTTPSVAVPKSSPLLRLIHRIGQTTVPGSRLKYSTAPPCSGCFMFGS